MKTLKTAELTRHLAALADGVRRLAEVTPVTGQPGRAAKARLLQTCAAVQSDTMPAGANGESDHG